MKSISETIQRICTRVALTITFFLFTALSLSGLPITASLCNQSWSHEAIVFVNNGLLKNLFLTALALLTVLMLLHMLSRLSGIILSAVTLGVWCAGTIILVWGANIIQMYDFAYVLEGAQLFARGNYKPLSIDYFNVYSYQLGFCLPMEFILRILPNLDLSLFMQLMNVFFSAGIAGILALLCHVLFDQLESKATLILYVFFLPFAFQCIFVYSTLPMLFCVSAATLCLSLYIKERKLRYLPCLVLSIAVAYMLKPNAAVPLIAMFICAVLDVLISRDIKLLIAAVLSVGFAITFQKLSILQYELRAGITLSGDVSMLARLVMGLQRGGAEAGWFNRYTEQFFPFDVSAAQEYAIASADLSARLAEMKANPQMTLAFFRDKLLSQWLEPSYGAMWYGNLCEHSGALSFVTKQLFLDGGPIRAALERFMGIYQKLLYLLTAIGLFSFIRNKKLAISVLVMPLCALGGCLYHMIFEAKAQYMYPYVLMMMPIAAHGLCVLLRFITNSNGSHLSLISHCK